VPVAVAKAPIAPLPSPVAVAASPIAPLPTPVAVALSPFAKLLEPDRDAGLARSGGVARRGVVDAAARRMDDASAGTSAMQDDHSRGDLFAVDVAAFHQQPHQLCLPAHAGLGKDAREVGARGAEGDSAPLRSGLFSIALHNFGRECGFSRRQAEAGL